MSAKDQSYDADLFEDYADDFSVDEEYEYQDVNSRKPKDHNSGDYNLANAKKPSYQTSDYDRYDDDNSKSPSPPATSRSNPAGVKSRAKDATPRMKKTYSARPSATKKADVPVWLKRGEPKSSGYGIQKGPGAAAPRRRHLSISEKSEVVDRVMSASRNKSKALTSVINDMQTQIEHLSGENRDLKKIARVQDREIKKLDSAEAELPFLLKKHSAEMLVLKDQCKKQRDAAERAKEDLKRRDEELMRTQDKLRAYETIVKDKNLAERSTLNNRLQEMEGDISVKQARIAELTRAVELKEKSRAREVKEKNEKYRKLIGEMKRLESDRLTLASKLKDKESALQKTNIYSKRLQQRRNSLQENYPELAAAILNQPTSNNERTSKSVMMTFGEETDEQTFMTAQPEASAEKGSPVRRRSGRGSQQQVTRQPSVVDESFTSESGGMFGQSHDTAVKRDGTFNLKDEAVGSSFDFTDEANPFAKGNNDRDRLDKIDQQLVDLKEREARERKEEAEERRKTELYDAEEQRKLQSELRREEELLRAEEELRREEEAAQRRHEEDERAKEKEQRAKENEEVARKKALLLAKMQAIDVGDNPDQVTASKIKISNNQSNRSPSPLNRKQQKPIFLRKNSSEKEDKNSNRSPRAGSAASRGSGQSSAVERSPKKSMPIFLQKQSVAGGNNSVDESSPRKQSGQTTDERRTSWTFRQQDENMLNGLPSHHNIDKSQDAVAASESFDDDVNFGAYQPTFAKTKGKKISNPSFDVTPETSPRHVNKNEGKSSPAGNGFMGVPAAAAASKKKSPFDEFDDFDDPFKSSTGLAVAKETAANKRPASRPDVAASDSFDDPFSLEQISL